MKYRLINIKSGSSKVVNESEKQYWSSSVYSRYFRFVELPETPRAELPPSVKKKKSTTQRKKATT